MDWFASIYEKYYHGLKRTLMRRGVSEENAEDVINNTAISLLQNKELKQDGATALFTKSVQLNALKIGRYNKEISISFDIEHHNTPETDYMKKQDVIAFYKCLELVPNKARKALELKLNGIYNQKSKDNCKYALNVLNSKMILNSIEVKQTVAYATQRK